MLIANRGEIAGRIARACREAGVRCIAAYSEADAAAPHLALADAVVCLGGAPASESYLNGERIVRAARETGADAIHPGYGFLSENPAFAALCEEAAIRFIGPPSEVIRTLGDKAQAKLLAQRAGVPIVPGYFGADQTGDRLAAEAVAIGAPLMIKATAGGGGRGMRLVRDLAEFDGLLRDARREALAVFGRDDVMIERFLDQPRHVEIQIFGDAEGRVFALHERECSLQRRQQKVLEESPSPGLTPRLREAMCAAAERLGEAANYRSAGTVEFLLEGAGDTAEFFFLEVNTRLQVEHPVTEARTGLDLVRMQIEIASGRPTPALRRSVPAFGHAIEARISAEDPAHGFAPSVGTLAVWSAPSGPGVRVDSGVRQGSEVSPYYDPMMAKLIVHAQTRDAAIARLVAALEEFYIVGVETNIPFLLDIARDPQFLAGETDIRFIERRFAGWRPSGTLPDEVLLALAATAGDRPAVASAARQQSAVAPAVWSDAGRWRNV
ncbi:MAG TPA: biotin carboxylase N-terminal domain-containing protein [Chthonomonadaceae bacterium]|nr:biotin carboxylase N-terminal domain-containing protein [Chthonomonadaceae bacterium]